MMKIARARTKSGSIILDHTVCMYVLGPKQDLEGREDAIGWHLWGLTNNASDMAYLYIHQKYQLKQTSHSNISNNGAFFVAFYESENLR